MQTTFSLGVVHDNKQKLKSAIAQHDDKLRAVISSACEDSGLADGKASAIIEAGMSRFTISTDGIVKPLSSFPDIDSFIDHHKTQAPETRIAPQPAIQVADNRHMRKQELYEQMKLYAETSQMQAYRACRAKYATL